MGNLDRIQLLKQFTIEEPENAFNWYALALEYRETDLGQAKQLFSKVLDEHPTYLAVYYPAANFFAELDEIDLAQSIFEKGIALAQEQANVKAIQELRNSYQNFKFENDLD